MSRPAEPTRPSTEEVILLERFRGGDPGAFHALVRPHLGSVSALARRLTGDEHWADDLVQETLVRAFRGLDRFRGESALRTWLFRIAIRLAAEPRRWRHSERAATLDHVEIPDTLGPAPDESVVVRELRDRIEEAMERLTTKQRTALHLRATEGMDYESIAGALGGTTGAARMLVLEARRHMRDRLGRYLDA